MNLRTIFTKIKSFILLRMLLLTGIILVFSFIAVTFLGERISRISSTTTIGITGNPLRINPLWSNNNQIDALLVPLIYRSIITFNDAHEPIGDLAESWTIENDGKEYTFTLKDDQYWQDGEQILADDIVFTHSLLQNDSFQGLEQNRFKGTSIEQIDDLTFVIRLEETFSPFIESMQLGILPKHIWDGMTIEQIRASEYNLMPVGSGPYRVSNVISDGTVVSEMELLSVTEDALVKKVILDFYSQEGSMEQAYQLGELDAFVTYNGLLTRTYLNWSNSELVKAPFCGQTITLFFNNQRDSSHITQNGDFKRVLYTIANLPRLNFTATFNPIPENHWAAVPADDPEQIPENELPGAIENLPNKDQTITLVTTQNEVVQTYARQITNQFKQFGLKINLEIVTNEKLQSQTLPEREFDILLVQQKLGHDPDQYNFWHSAQTNIVEGGLNASGYTSRQVDRALEQGRIEGDSIKRKDYYKTFQEELTADKPALFVSYPALRIVQKITNEIEQVEGCIWHQSDFLTEILLKNV